MSHAEKETVLRFALVAIGQERGFIEHDDEVISATAEFLIGRPSHPIAILELAGGVTRSDGECGIDCRIDRLPVDRPLPRPPAPLVLDLEIDEDDMVARR